MGQGAEVKYNMRTKGTGSFDGGTKTWRLKGKGIHATTRQLERRYGVKFTATEPERLKKESVTYWRRWLQDTEEDAANSQKANSPLQERLRSLERVLRDLNRDNAPDAILECYKAMYRDAAQVAPEDIDHADVPVIHPQVHPALKLLGTSDPLIVRILNATVSSAAAAPKVTIATEVKHALQVHLARTGLNAHYHFTRQALELLMTTCGQLEPHQLTVDHWRTFFAKVTTREKWGIVTQSNAIRAAKRFAKTVSQARGTNVGFVDLQEFAIDPGEGDKVKYTFAEVKTALDHATGTVRLQLLLGLNAGMTTADILTLKPDMIQGDYVVWKRCKLARIKEGGKAKDYSPVAVLKHKLWGTTKQALNAYTFDATEYQLDHGFFKFTRKHMLPVNKALRKTVTQLIEDRNGNDAGRHYRGELKGGTHMKNYVERRLGDKEQGDLDTALDAIGTHFGL